MSPAAHAKSLTHEQARAAGHGDCIDCDLCVQVCPTGIDIRKGLQYECITCAACIDACDSVMDRMNYPRGLIRYTTENALEGKRSHILRPRLLGYFAALVVMVGLFVWALGDRMPLGFEVERERGQLYHMTRDGRISNVYTLTVRNLDDSDHVYDLSASGLPGLALDTATLSVPAGSSRLFAVQVTADPAVLELPSHPIQLHLASQQNTQIRIDRDTRFIGDTRR